MIDFAPPRDDQSRPSVADAKRGLEAWGDAAEVKAAAFRSRVSKRAVRTATNLGVALLIAVTIRRLLHSPARHGVPPRRPGVPSGLRNSEPIRAPDTVKKSVASWVGWGIAARLASWLLPHAVDAARTQAESAAARKAAPLHARSAGPEHRRV